jgi:hypothetical protein
MPTTTDLRSHQPERSEVLTQGINKGTRAGLEPMPCYVVLVWGMDKKGQQIKVLINTCDQKTARHAAAAALADLGAYAHFFIAPTKDKALIEQWQKPWQGFVPTRHSSPAQAPLSLHHEVSI